MPAKSSPVVNEDASAEEHQNRIGAEGEAYVASALASTRPAETRARALSGALAYLARCSGHTGSRSSTVRREAALSSIVAAAIDDRVPLSALISAANAAADDMLLPVLGKILCIISGMSKVESLADAGEESDASADDISDESAAEDGTPAVDEFEDGARKRKGGHSSAPPAKKRRSSAACERKGDVARRGGVCGGTGQDYVDDFVCRLTSPQSRVSGSTQGSACAVDSRDDVFVATAARESRLSAKAVVIVLENLLARLRRVGVFELPAFVYQVLLLVSSRGNSTSKRNVLRAIIVHFAALETASRTATAAASQAQEAEEDDLILSHSMTLSTVRQIQSTTLLHVDFAVKQDPSLIAELTKLSRVPADSPNSIMVPFGVAILLALARAPSVQTNVLGHLAEAIQRFDREVEIRAQSHFASRISRRDDPMSNPRDAVLRAIESSSRDGWDLISEPLLQLGLLLTEKHKPAFWISSSPKKRTSEAEFGSDVLVELFALHSSLRHEIVEQLVTRLVLRERGSPLAVRTLARLARRSPSNLLECTTKIKECFFDLVTLPPWTSNAVILALKPLFQMRSDLRDTLFLALRKGLFHREPCARAVASLGFLEFMSRVDATHDFANEKASVHSQEVEYSQAVIEEALQPLRRALTHPPAIRALLYKEASRLVRALPQSSDQTAICNGLHALFQPHALRYINAAESPFLLLDRCVSESSGGQLVEPLGDLLECLTSIQHATSKVFSKEYLLELARKIATISIRDFDISKESRSRNSGDATHRGGEDDGQAGDENGVDSASRAEVAAEVANRNRTRVLGGVAEALLNVALSVEDAAHTPKLYTDCIFPLLQLREDAFNVLKELGAASAADAVRDLGGDVDIEPGSGQAIGWCLSSGSSSKLSRKGEVKKEKVGKRKAGNATTADRTAGASGGAEGGARFGSFGILVSSSSCPPVTLANATRCLEAMRSQSGETRDHQSGITGRKHRSEDPRYALRAWFEQGKASKESEKLAGYLFGVAKRHVETVISNTGASSSYTRYQQEFEILAESLCSLAWTAMSDFQDNRSRTGATHSKLSVRSLELVESCITAVHQAMGADPKMTSSLCASMLFQRPRQRPSGSANSEIDADDGHVVGVMKALQKTTHALMEDRLFKEAEVIVRILRKLVFLYQAAFREMKSFCARCDEVIGDVAIWSQNEFEVSLLDGTQTSASVSGIGDAMIVKGLASLSMIERDSSGGLEFAKRLANRVYLLLGSALEDKGCAPIEDEASGPLALVTRANVLHVVDSVLDVVHSSFDDVQWCLGRLTSMEAAAVLARTSVGGTAKLSPRKMPFSAMDDNQQAEMLERRATKAEDAAHRRLVLVIDVLAILMSSAIGKWSHQERLLKCATRCYKLISISVGAQARRRNEPRPTFLELTTVTKRLSPVVWDYALFLNSDDGGARGTAPSSAREARLMPQLVYEVERFEKLLISVSKRSKVNLLSGIKRNTARDYRITERETNKENELDEA